MRPASSLILILAALLTISYQARNSLGAGQVLYENEVMQSVNGGYFFKVQPDGNCVIYMSPHFSCSNAIWHSSSNNRGASGRKLEMQTDGNLVLRGGDGKINWLTNTPNKGAGGYYLLLQNDANLVIYDKTNKPIWSSNTARW